MGSSDVYGEVPVAELPIREIVGETSVRLTRNALSMRLEVDWKALLEIRLPREQERQLPTTHTEDEGPRAIAGTPKVLLNISGGAGDVAPRAGSFNSSTPTEGPFGQKSA
jgi:hypothetical protein